MAIGADWKPHLTKFDVMSEKKANASLPQPVEGSPRRSKTKKAKKASLPEIMLPAYELLQCGETSQEELLMRHKVKKLSLWFHTWAPWQRRVLVCSVMSCCTREQLQMLATSLEPLLHMDFSTGLLPPLQALHLDGVTLFHIQRAVTQRLSQPEADKTGDSDAYLNSLPSTFFSFNTNRFCRKSSRISIRYSSPVAGRPDSQKSHPSSVSLRDEPKVTVQYSGKKRQEEKEKTPVKESILPAVPLIHPDHLTAGGGANRETSFTQLLGRQRFSSVPDFRSTTDLLKQSGKRWTMGQTGRAKRRTTGAILATIQSWKAQKTEMFKDQLALVTSWMAEWRGIYRFYLLSELVKLCDHSLLGYFVQCLYQQLHEKTDINSLPDSILHRIFGYLSPADLCRVSQVCRRWNICANLPSLWKKCAYHLGATEGVGDVVEIMESVIRHYRHSLRSVGGGADVIDWKRVYRDLRKLLQNMKRLVLKSASASETGSGQLLLGERLKGVSTRAQACSVFTLVELLEILRAGNAEATNMTTHQLYHMCPESASAIRRRLRMERRAEGALAESGSDATLTGVPLSMNIHSKLRSQHHTPMKSSVAVFSPMHTWTPTHNLEFAQNLIRRIQQKDLTYEQLLKQYSLYDTTTTADHGELAQRIAFAVDSRPKAPTLPNPNAVTCMILSGNLLSSHFTKPGQIVHIPRIRRMNTTSSVALCMQCDSRKIVTGNHNRTIHVYDIRTGRPVATLRGHKGSVQCLQYDDYKIVSGSWDTTCIVWDIVHFKMLRQLNGHMECVSCLQFDEDILVTGSHDGSLRVWSTASWDTLSIMTAAHPNGILCLKMNERIIVSGGVNSEVKVWSVSSYHCLKTLPHHAPITALALSHLLLVTCSMEGVVIFWNLDSYEPISRMHTARGCYVKQLAPLHSKYYAAGSDSLLYELDISTCTCIRTLRGHSRILTAIWAVDHKLVSTSADHTIVVWSFRRPGPRGPPLELEFSDHQEGEEIIVREMLHTESDREVGDGEVRLEGVGGEEEEEEHREYLYLPPRYYSTLPLRIVKEDCTDCCGFVYDF